ncbi:MAG: ABC transporter permease [Oscillospiraceae bacterium]|nr:ABC transporter permease [Oscillospiraceae bacterium]
MGENSSIRRFLRIRGLGPALTAFVGWIVILFAFAAIDQDRVMLKSQNIMNLLRSMSFFLLVGIGQSYVLITGNIDLSIGSVAGMSAMISATLMCNGTSAPLAILISFLCCLVVGVINGVLVGGFKLPPFIATLGTMFVARGAAYMVNKNRNTDAISTGIGKEAADRFQQLLYYGKTLGIFNTFLIAIAIFAIFFFILSKTRTGRHIYAIGSNIDAAKLSGVNVQSTIIKVYLISAINSCVVGYFLVAQASMGNMEAGLSYEMYGVAAGVIGGVSPLGGTGLLLGTLAGAGVWQTLQNGLSMIGAQVGLQRIVIGVIVVFAVLLDVVLRTGKRTKKIKTKTSANVEANIDAAAIEDSKDTD